MTTTSNPQPILAQMEALVTGSGLSGVSRTIGAVDLEPPVQRAIYRIV
jgi:hypothetical protein